MSQSKLNDFFALKKGIRDAQPSKRRKLATVSSGEEVISKRPMMEDQPSSNQVKYLEHDAPINSLKLDKSVSGIQSIESKVTPNASRLPKAKVSTKNTRAKKSLVKRDDRQKNLSDFIVRKDKTGIDNVEEARVRENEIIKGRTEEVTSFWDDHEDQQCTPRKKIMSEMESLSQGPKGRVKKTAARKLNQVDTEAQSSSQFAEVKKKLDLVVETESDAKNKTSDNVKSSEKNEPDSSPKSSLLNLVGEMSGIQDAISPLALTPEHSGQPGTVIMGSGPTNITPKLQDLSVKLKALSKMDGQALKNRLKKKGILGEVKEKVQELSKANSELKASPVVKRTSQEKTETLPAYQRYDYLVKDEPPTLILPYAYRLLESAFQAMDTVVSMLHNRSEICTFKKLQASVQNMTKKNFPEKTAGQVKTVVPDAFSFKQEKVPVYGQRSSLYALVIEANLGQDEVTKKNMTKSGKIPFTASVLLKRKSLFKSNLLKIVKAHHKSFLESLNPPLHVPDAKLSRWHPKFALDKVSEVLSSPLPQSPDVRVLHSAKDVLELQIGKLNPRLEKALTKVAAESSLPQNSRDEQLDKDKVSDVPPSKENLSQAGSKPSVSSPAPSLSSMKGIPPALLAKIRAKEALKMEQALTRDPAEDKKTRMMGHLPEMIRILRSYFVTEKKPALLMESVIKKLGDSLHTGMPLGDIEQHIKLLTELAPKLLSIVEVKKGKFIKWDKNIDISILSKQIMDMVKARM